MAILHGCTIGEGSLVGMGATVLNGAVIGQGVLVGAGALVTEGKEIPDGVLVVGPARRKVVRDLTAEEIAGLAPLGRRLPRQHGALQGRASASCRAERRSPTSAGVSPKRAVEPWPAADERLAQQRELHAVGPCSSASGAPSVTCAQSAGRRRGAAAVDRERRSRVGATPTRTVPAHRQALLEAEDGEVGEPRQRRGRGRRRRPPRRR